MRAYRLLTGASLSLPLVWSFGVVGCSSSSSGGAAPGEDAGTDAPSLEDAPSTQDGTMPSTSPEGGDAGGEETGTADGGEGGAIAQQVTQTNLFADTADGGAPHVDPNLVNPWGLAFSPSGIAWISDNGPGLATLYETSLTAPLPRVVTVPPPGGSPAGTTAAPSGQILNPGASAGDFKGDTFIISTEDGTVAGWNGTADPFNDAGASTATLEYDNSAAGAVYKGLAINPTTPAVLLVADFHNNHIDVLDRTYAKIASDGGTAWTDPSVPTGYAPFNIFVDAGKVYVAYAKQDQVAHDDAAGPGNGAVSVFDTTGTLVTSLVKSGGALNSPWGLAMAPTGWGALGGTLLVGNFGDGHVNAYSPTTGAWVGNLVTGSGTALAIDGLWALTYGVSNSDAGISTAQLYFTAGPNDESDGLYGYLSVP
jgi:uncharacterized protein (TIGR03118 family)